MCDEFATTFADNLFYLRLAADEAETGCVPNWFQFLSTKVGRVRATLNSAKLSEPTPQWLIYDGRKEDLLTILSNEHDVARLVGELTQAETVGDVIATYDANAARLAERFAAKSMPTIRDPNLVAEVLTLQRTSSAAARRGAVAASRIICAAATRPRAPDRPGAGRFCDRPVEMIDAWNRRGHSTKWDR